MIVGPAHPGQFLSRNMRFLKRLQLQGYKTFATRTEFDFDSGITAIVGPNGSGKSNIADGLRWVLGEQSFGSLRGKKTEDMIFSGSEKRARLGMAYVSLVFDNSSHWLPIDFSEVEVARRAYRSGENEYFVNGNRVRLRDITELLGSSGLSERTYSVIGQGLIDQALAQRPESRRRLFEEAAGITVHQSKRDQASQKLTEALANLTRAKDIASELAPRLRYLKGQARRAHDYQQLRKELDAKLHTWYGHRWHQALQDLLLAQQRAANESSSATHQVDQLSALVDAMSGQRSERTALREKLGEWHRESSDLHRQAEAIQRELAVRNERHRLWGIQREEMEREIVQLRAALEDGSQRLSATRQELERAGATHAERSTRLAEAQAALAAQEQDRQRISRQAAQAQDELLQLKTRLADRQSRLAQNSERRAELEKDGSEQREAAAAAAEQLRALEEQSGVATGRISKLVAELTELDRARAQQEQLIAQAEKEERQLAEVLQRTAREIQRLIDQRDMLSRLQDEGAGMSAGPRAILGERQRLPGLVGSMGELIEVPNELERAIEAAMGNRLQDIVVRSWEDAEQAVAFLKQRQAGRATFLPLDSLRPGRPSDVPRGGGIVGLASELVKYDKEIKPAVELALNRILVVEDLQTARRLVRQESRSTLVTLEGELVRPGGSVTGGSEGNRRDSGVLARARTLRELPPKIANLELEAAALQKKLATARDAQSTARGVMTSLRESRSAIVVHQQQLTNEQGRINLQIERLRQAGQFMEDRSAQVSREIGEIERRQESLVHEQSTLAERIAEVERQLQAHKADVATLVEAAQSSDAARLRVEAAAAAGELSSLSSRCEELAALQRGREAEVAAKSARSQEIARLQNEAAAYIAEKSVEAQRLAELIDGLAAKIEPAEARVAEIEAQQRRSEADERSLRDRLRHAQMRQNQADLTVQRCQDELAHLRSEIEKELGPVSIEEEAAAGTQQPLPLNGDLHTLRLVPALPEGLDQEVRELRSQMARLGPVNLEAVDEYNEVEARHNFLTTQSADLEVAVETLKQVIADLDQVMEREFLETFRAIARQFREEFATLFGGGSAKLVLTEPESPATSGVEIIARPPGKREQGLALLSGGERALTAAALIFSILKARPTPFCVLDEVDAALDEANVGRFRDALKALSEQTQFILITHNRGTIEAADTIYGISMGADNTSLVLSMRLEGRELVPSDASRAD